MIKRILAILLVLCILNTGVCIAFTESKDVRASEMFFSASTTLNASKSVTFYCRTNAPANQIRVNYCWLQQKVDGKWEFVKHLTPPSYTGSGTAFFQYTQSYASEIGSGTYRVAATYGADGHVIAAYSGERTF